jgi:transposase InsO family protein
VAIDDASRLAYTEILPSLGQEDATGFLQRALAWYARLGVSVERVMTDNGSAYRSKLFNKTCQALGIKHTYTRPYTPQTNGKAERFIQTCLREWAYGRLWNNSQERTSWLPIFLDYYNNRRAHSALGYRPPASRLGGNNLLTINS